MTLVVLYIDERGDHCKRIVWGRDADAAARIAWTVPGAYAYIRDDKGGQR